MSSTPGKNLGARTVAVHAGSRLSSLSEPISPAIHVAAVSYFDDAETLDGALDGKDFTYLRIAGQNAALLEEAIAALEGAEDCAVFPSGMAAIKAVFEAEKLQPGDVVVIPLDGYGASRSLMKALCAERGVTLHSVAFSSPGAAAKIQELKPKLVVAESMTNPLLSVADLPAIADACHAVGAVFMVDATFTSPALQKVLAQGADYAVQSTTKWINGHSDAAGGAVSGTRARIAPLKAARILHGAILGPFEAWLTLRGLRTLPLRMREHCANALALAERLSQSKLLERVLYPGLPSNPHHAVAKKMFGASSGSSGGGFGGMVAFEIRGAARPDGFKFLEAVKLAKPAPSLGDVATLVMHAASASARRMTPEERAAAGIGENLIRVSVGLEDPDDVADDLIQAVRTARGPR